MPLRRVGEQAVLRRHAPQDRLHDGPRDLIGARIRASDAGWSSQVARRAHNPEVAGSNPAPAIDKAPANAGALSFCTTRRRLDYVVSRLAPAAVATRYLKLIEDETPADWLRSPRDITYAWGVGLSRDRVREVVAAIVREHGEDALLLSDRPVVREQLLARES